VALLDGLRDLERYGDVSAMKETFAVEVFAIDTPGLVPVSDIPDRDAQYPVVCDLVVT